MRSVFVVARTLAMVLVTHSRAAAARADRTLLLSADGLIDHVDQD